MRRIVAMALLAACALTALVFGTGANGGGGDPYEVRAIFDNVAGAVEGEDVKIAGAKVGAIGSLDVTPDNKAIAVLEIEQPGFAPFHTDARCTIRPQSLIGEKFVECDPGSKDKPELRELGEGEKGAGQHLLPVERTSAPVDIDLINDIMRLPYRQRLAILINEFGTALAGRGRELNEVIHRANPALRETDELLRILARQNRTLAQLAEDSDTVLEPLARERARVSSFIVQADQTAKASAERRGDLARTFERLPRFLKELKPTMEELGSLSDEMLPVVTDLGEAAPDLNRFILALGPFSRQSVPSLDSLGEALEVGGPALERSEPLLGDLRKFGEDADPLSKDLDALLTSFDESGGIERLMDYIFFQVTAINGYDSLSHYLRAGLIASLCSQYSIQVVEGCESTFGEARVEGGAANAARKRNAKIAERLSDVPRNLKSKPPRGVGIGERLKQILGVEDPVAKKRREQNIERLREGAKQPPQGPYGPAQPLLDYLMGNDG